MSIHPPFRPIFSIFQWVLPWLALAVYFYRRNHPSTQHRVQDGTPSSLRLERWWAVSAPASLATRATVSSHRTPNWSYGPVLGGCTIWFMRLRSVHHVIRWTFYLSSLILKCHWLSFGWIDLFDEEVIIDVRCLREGEMVVIDFTQSRIIEWRLELAFCQFEWSTRSSVVGRPLVASFCGGLLQFWMMTWWWCG